MKGIKEHKHSERQKVIREMTPLIKNKFGDNLLALAACCSYARNDDHLYSDLELIAFVKEMPKDKPQGGLAKIVDGMLIELMWMTKETYLNTVLDVNEYWHYSGSDTLLPIINEEFINELKNFKPKDLKRKCLEYAVGVFTEYHEATSKVLNAVSQNNHKNMAVLFFDMINQILRILSFLNQKPYITASQMISQVREFSIKPKSLDHLLDITVEGKYNEFDFLKQMSLAVFEEIEKIFEELGLKLYDDDVNPDRAVNELRQL